MAAEQEQFNLQILLQPDGVVAPMLNALKECSQSVLFGLKSIDQITTLPETLIEEDYFGRQEFGEADNFDIQKGKYKSWLVSKGFEEIIGGVKYSLIEAYKFVSIVKWSGGKTVNTTIEKINSDFDDIRRNASKQSLPGLLEKVETHLTAPLAYETHIVSLNKMRNCLVHRKGVVSIEDVNTTNNTLQVKWMRHFLFVDTKDGEVELVKNFQNITGTDVSIKHKIKEDEKEFKLNEIINVSFKEFQEFMTTCYLFAYDVAEKLPKLS